MSLIEVEFLRTTFEAFVGVVAKSHAVVPTPTLAPIGGDRLISQFTWHGDPEIVTEMPGYAPPAGTVLFRSSVTVAHVSVAELRANANATGASVDGHAWLLAATSLSQVSLSVVGFAVGEAAPAILTPAVMLEGMPIPVPNQVALVQTAIVADASTVVVRLATALTDDIYRPLAGRLPARLSEIGGSTNWLIHVPAQVFCDLVMKPISDAMSGPLDGATIEEMPAATWCQVPGGAWGVRVHAGLEKKNACPGLFGKVDISVDVVGNAGFTADPANSQIMIALEIVTDTSDWDSFRCWLGSGGIGSVILNLFVPYTGVVAAIGSLVYISETLRSKVGDAAAARGVPNFTQTGHTDSTVTYAGAFPVQPLPFSTSFAYDFGPEGFDLSGMIVPLPPTHVTQFKPDNGPLKGTWTRKVNCSHRSVDTHFAFKPVVVSDNLQFGDTVLSYLPVMVYLTSLAEPVGKCAVKMPDAVPDVQVVVDCTALQPGNKGFAVIHTSAGLRAYVLGPVSGRPRIGREMSFINEYCDTFHVQKPVVAVRELRWVEPPPDYEWGFAPLRQWQIVVTDLPTEAHIDLHAAHDEHRVLASRRDFAGTGTRAAIVLVTDRASDLVMRTSGASDGSQFALTTRWLLPLVRSRVEGDVTGIATRDGDILLNIGGRWSRFDSSNGRPRSARFETEPDARVTNQPGQTVSLKHGRIALVDAGELVIAIPSNSVVRAES
jgi:hypothetical protein